MLTFRHLLAAAACLLALAAPPAAEARPTLVALARGHATLSAPAATVSLTAAVRRCQRGGTLTLRVGGARLTARLPRRASLRRTWPVQAAGPVRFGTALNWAALQEDGAYAENAGRFSSWTPENEMKMEALVPRADLLGTPQYDFATADALVARALAEGRQVHGHTLVFKQQVPEWLRKANWPADRLRAFLRDYIHTVVGRYRGRITSWDVVNEPLDADGHYDASTFWASRLGPSYIADAFRWAREADPAATLHLNEVVDVGGPMADATYALVRDLREQGVPVGGVGLQTHVDASQSVLTREAFQATDERFAALGVKVAVSEMDVALTSPLDEALQARIFADAAAACASVPACERFTVWGVSDRYSWLGAQKMGLPIDGDYRLKPGWQAIAAALATRR